MMQGNLLVMVVLILVLLAFSAFFSGSETALMAISRLRLRHLAETKPVRAKFVERLLNRPERLIGTILLGNNLVNVAMTAICTAIAVSLWGEKGVAYVTAVLTVAILIFAEITPKVYAKYFNESVSFVTAPILNAIMILLGPLVSAVTFTSNKLLLIVGVDVSKMKKPLLTEEEVMTCIKMGWDEGAISTQERRLLARVFMLNDKTVGEVMVPQEQMAILDLKTSKRDIVRIVQKTGYTRFPVKKGGPSDIVGSIHAKDLFAILDNKTASVKKILRPPYFVPMDRKIDVQLRAFQAKRLHQAVVLDAEGRVAGLITLEDIVEELVGSIRDEHDA